MVAKRLNIELPVDQYEFICEEARGAGMTISALLRRLVEDCRNKRAQSAAKEYQSDPLFSRRGSFEGPEDLAEQHDSYLYQ